ncbi:MAG: taurine dioxygenase [Balneolaceae bacterium]
MTAKKFNLIDRQLISDMLFGEEKYIIEFADASIQSFSEFSKHYRKYLLERDLENFRRVGHKIKPVAQMLHLKKIIEEYEHAKKLLEEDQPDKELQRSANTITSICEQVIKDFKRMRNKET